LGIFTVLTLPDSSGNISDNAKGHCCWVNWHFKTNPRIQNLTDEEVAKMPPFGAVSRSFRGDDLLRPLRGFSPALFR
jgi:hypothetical protein